MNKSEPPKIFIDLSGGLIQQIMATQEVEVIAIDYDDLETGSGRIVEVDGIDPAYVFRLPSIDVAPDRVKELFKQIGKTS